MLNANVQPSRDIGLVGLLAGKSRAAGTYTTGWIAAKDFAHFLAMVEVADTGLTAGTVNAKLTQASDSDGTGAKDITGKAITQIGGSSPSEDKVALITLRADELDLANSFTHFRLSITVADAAVQIGGRVLGVAPRYGDATDFDVSSVVEVVN